MSFEDDPRSREPADKEEYEAWEREQGLKSWVAERLANCERIARIKQGADKNGWLEDAEYFRQLLAIMERTLPTEQQRCFCGGPAICALCRHILPSYEVLSLLLVIEALEKRIGKDYRSELRLDAKAARRLGS